MSKDESRNKIQNLKKNLNPLQIKEGTKSIKNELRGEIVKRKLKNFTPSCPKWSKIKRYQKNPIMSANLREERKRNIFQLEKEKVSRDLNWDINEPG